MILAVDGTVVIIDRVGMHETTISGGEQDVTGVQNVCSSDLISGRAGRSQSLLPFRAVLGINTFSQALLLSKEQLIKIHQPLVLGTRFDALMMEDSMTQQPHNLQGKEHFIFTKK